MVSFLDGIMEQRHTVGAAYSFQEERSISNFLLIGNTT